MKIVVSSLWCLLLLPTFIHSMAMKHILVTGGNKGIGKAICERLLSEWSDTHVLLGTRSLQRGEEAVNDIVQALGKDVKDRLSLVEIDTSSDESVKKAADQCQEELYGIINNAGVGWGFSLEETLNVNYFGPRRVNDAFRTHLKTPGGRVVNVASASGPNFLQDLDDQDLKTKLHQPWLIPGKIEELDSMARSVQTSNHYGVSKAFLNAYTVLDAKLNPDLVINSVTPGFISTDLTAGTTASNPPSKGAVPPCFLMMDEAVAKEPTGRYYGSDCLRSPMHFYRGPGEPVYEGQEDLVSIE